MSSFIALTIPPIKFTLYSINAYQTKYHLTKWTCISNLFKYNNFHEWFIFCNRDQACYLNIIIMMIIMNLFLKKKFETTGHTTNKLMLQNCQFLFTIFFIWIILANNIMMMMMMINFVTNWLRKRVRERKQQIN